MPHEPWQSNRYEFVWRGVTPAVRVLLGLTAAVFLLQLLFYGQSRPDGGFHLTNWLALSRVDLARGQVWRVVTSVFAHDPNRLLHFLMNMIWLVLAGSILEAQVGSRWFAIVYLAAGVLGGLVHPLLFAHSGVIGASGAVSGVLAALVALNPMTRMSLIFLPHVPIRVWMLGAFYFGLDLLLFLGRVVGGGEGDRVAHDVHLAGGLVGLVIAVVVFRPDWAAGRFPGLRGRPRLRVVPPVAGSGRSRARPAAPPRAAERSGADHPPTQSEVDAVLDKMAGEGGFAALTSEDRAILEKASAAARSRR